MLILSRMPNERIMIGDSIQLVVLGVKGQQVKLGIQAPRHLPVHRQEVYQEIEEENRRASQATRSSLSSIASALKERPSSK